MASIKDIFKQFKSIFNRKSFLSVKTKKNESISPSSSLNETIKEIIHYNSMNDNGRYLPDYDLISLAEKAKYYFNNQDYDETLNLYTQIINSSLPDSQFKAYYLKSRKMIFSKLNK